MYTSREQQQQHYQHGMQHEVGASEFFLAPNPFTNVMSNFSLSAIPQPPQQQQQQPQPPQQQQQQQPQQESSSAVNVISCDATVPKVNYGGYNCALLQAPLTDMSHLMWTTPKPDGTVMPTASSVEGTSDTTNCSTHVDKYVFSSADGHVGGQGECNNQAYLQPMSVTQEESTPAFLLFPSQGNEVSVAINPYCLVLPNTHGDIGNVYFQHGTLLSADSLRNAFVPSFSAPINSANQSQHLLPFTTPHAELQATCNQNSVRFPCHSQSKSGAIKTMANQYHEQFESPKFSSVDNTFSMLNAQWQAHYGNVHVKMPTSSTFFPPCYPYKCASSGARRKSTCNAPQCHSCRGSNCYVKPEKERRGGLPFNEDPVPIEVTKTQLLVNFIPQFLTDDEFRELFIPFGEIHKKPTKIIYDREARRAKGYGFVYYKDGRSTEAAIKTLNGFLLGGRMLKVRYAEQQRSSVDCDSCTAGDDDGEDEDDDDIDGFIDEHVCSSNNNNNNINNNNININDAGSSTNQESLLNSIVSQQ